MEEEDLCKTIRCYLKSRIHLQNLAMIHRENNIDLQKDR